MRDALAGTVCRTWTGPSRGVPCIKELPPHWGLSRYPLSGGYPKGKVESTLTVVIEGHGKIRA